MGEHFLVLAGAHCGYLIYKGLPLFFGIGNKAMVGPTGEHEPFADYIAEALRERHSSFLVYGIRKLSAHIYILWQQAHPFLYADTAI